MHSVQMEILPRVREAQSIMAREFLSPEETSAVNEKIEPPNDSIETDRIIGRTAYDSKSEEDAAGTERNSSRNFSFDWKNILLGGFLITLLFLVGLLMYKLLF